MFEIIQQLAATNSRLAKEAIILEQAEANNDQFFQGCKLAFSPFITFGVKKVPVHSGNNGAGLEWDKFLELADALANRVITGHDARDAIQAAMEQSTQDQWDGWYRLILAKDFRAGFSETILNKIVLKADKPDYVVEIFSCQLAHDGAKHEKKMVGKKLLEVKGDGVRCLTVINAINKTVTQYSRNGKVLENFTHITDAIQKNIELFDRSIVLDGEVMSDNFQQLMKQLYRKSDVQSQDARLLLFDIIPLSEFRNGESILGQRRRSRMLQDMKPVFEKVGYIDVIPQVEVDLDDFVGQVQFKEFNKKAIESGFEGVMLKDVDAVYECKRSASWLKSKPYITVDLTVVEVEEGTGKYEGQMGALVCHGNDGDREIRVNVGSGFTDSDRASYWDSRDSIIGQVVEIRADAVTQNQDGNYSLRFPRFERFRGFTAGEKI